MRNIETYNKLNEAEKAKLNAAQWQIDLLKMNPEYTSWGCFEDVMSDDNKHSWRSRKICNTWQDFGPWELDDYNEVVNFYFQVSRKGHDCPNCGGSGLNKQTRKLDLDWYDFDNTGRKWSDKLTDIEVVALLKHGRLFEWFRGRFDETDGSWYLWENGKNGQKVKVPEPQAPSAEEVNRAYRKGLGHDAINRWICVEARAKHLGVYGECHHCSGGVIYDDPTAHVSLQLWVLHPRKGASRGVFIEYVQETDIPAVLQFLKEAANRNANRFKRLPELSPD